MKILSELKDKNDCFDIDLKNIVEILYFFRTSMIHKKFFHFKVIILLTCLILYCKIIHVLI